MSSEELYGTKGQPLARQAIYAEKEKYHSGDSGDMLNGSPAATENLGLLTPAHSLWIMGFPKEWLNYAP